ncbi:hypothetical protein [Thiocapsa sp.]|uniref:hypothetical protein n=1 Tax=Thiocapsa sp. TaxID=2024551 RepID=UPI002632FDEC|nr:hypothetical protein [Thiocapsa sp.]
MRQTARSLIQLGVLSDGQIAQVTGLSHVVCRSHSGRLTLRGELRQTELRLQKEIKHSRNSLLLWLIPLMFARVGAIAALVKLL